MVTNDILETMEPVKASSKQYMESPEVEAVAKAIIKNHNLDFGPADIVYFLVYPNISKKKAAQAIKCSDLVRFYSGNDFAVKVSGELWDMLDSKTKELMIYHQLLHFSATFNSKNAEWKFSIRKPSYTNYYEIDDKHGNEFHKTIQATMSSLYDMEPKDEDQISLF